MGAMMQTGGGGGIDDICQLGPGNPVFVRHRLHDCTHGQAVEVVIDEDQDAQDTGGQFRGPTAGDLPGGPLAVGLGTAGLVHHTDQGTQQGQEQDDIEFVRGPYGLGHDFKSGRTHGHQTAAGSSCINQAAGQDPQHQGRNHFFGDKRKRDGNNRGQQGKNPHINRFHNRLLFVQKL